MDGLTTPYSTISPYFASRAEWVPEEEQERIGAYLAYDDIYWSRPEAFKLMTVDEDTDPIYVPKARTIVDTTSHYLLKGLKVDTANKTMREALDDLFARERFYSKFHTAKHSGVTRGDFILHITADSGKAEGRRISINSVHPAAYFPVYDDWDPDKLIRVHLAEQFERWNRDKRITETFIRKLTYEYEYREGDTRRVWRTEGFFKVQDWFDPKKQEMVRSLLKRTMLPEEIDTIPAYHFTNGQWQGEDYGSSELRGFERLLLAINQTITDEEVALALEGLGVYATDAAGPVDPQTNQRVNWEIAPARVMEVPTGSFFKRVEGVGSVTPMLDHVRYLVEAVFEASATTDVARGAVDDARLAESGIALAIKFLPTQAKIEQRDQDGVSTMDQFMWDMKAWWNAFEGMSFDENDKFDISLGDKLPKNVTEELNELNNMFDRKLISGAFYRERMAELRGYAFPDDLEQQIADDAQKAFEAAQKLAELNKPAEGEQTDPGAGKSGVAGRPKGGGKPKGENRSRNRNRPNESGGTEA